jgi:uncharacterized protein (UPF0335 family)
MSIARRIEELEAAAYRMGFDALSARMAERLRPKSEAEITAMRAMLEEYMTTGKAMPGLLEALQEITEP